MSSPKDSVGGADTPSDHVEFSDDELSEDGIFDLDEEMVDASNENVDNDDEVKQKWKSEAWDHFKRVEVKEEGKIVKKDECIHRKKAYKAQKTRATTQLLRHLKACSYMKRTKGNKSCINFEKSGNGKASSSVGFEHMKCREIIAKMIVAHELPFSFVKYHWFNVLMKYNNPFYKKVSRGTIRKECMKLVEADREKIKKVFKNVDMISLTSDCWTSNQTVGYMCLTAHYVDSNWKLQKRIIGFNELEPPHSGSVIAEGILECLIKWGIQEKIGTITHDNASNNDRAANILMNNYQRKGKLHFEGLFFHVRCCAHILNLVVLDGLGKIDSCLVKIREGVKYLRKSHGRLLKFGCIAKDYKLNTNRSLCTDVKTRWNSTHRMLESALHYKSTFEDYALGDPGFEWSLTNEEWDRAKKVTRVLEVFLDASNLFSGTSYPTTNLFLVEIFKVKKEIANAFESKDGFLKAMSVPMYEKFEKYWGEIGVLMSIASMLDPRFKDESVRFTFSRMYPTSEVESRVTNVTGTLKSLHKKNADAFVLAKKAKSSSKSTCTSSVVPNVRARVQDDDFYAYLKSRSVENTQTNEVDIYLKEPKYEYEYKDNIEFDVLKWWSENCGKFPVLSKMARHIFSIPITTGASESAFSAGGRILDDYRSSLTKDMVELLVCGGDWLKSESKATIQTLELSAKEEEDLEIKVFNE